MQLISRDQQIACNSYGHPFTLKSLLPTFIKSSERRASSVAFMMRWQSQYVMWVVGLLWELHWYDDKFWLEAMRCTKFGERWLFLYCSLPRSEGSGWGWGRGSPEWFLVLGQLSNSTGGPSHQPFVRSDLDSLTDTVRLLLPDHLVIR